MPVPNHIRRLRDSLGISASTLAEEVGVSPSALSRWESGSREVSDDHKRALAEYFNLPVGAIFEFEYSPMVDALLRFADAQTALRLRVDRLEQELAMRRAS